MAFACKDCSYRGTTSGPTGGCPACGSFNFGREIRQEKPPPGKLRLILLVLLWLYLFGMILWELNS